MENKKNKKQNEIVNASELKEKSIMNKPHYSDNNKPFNPKFALLDHLKNKTSFATNYYKNINEAVDEFINMYGVEQLREFCNEPDIETDLKTKMDEILDNIEFIATVQDHNSQDYINFQDELNTKSVSK